MKLPSRCRSSWRLQPPFGARKALDRVRRSVNLFDAFVTGESGEAALIAIRDEVEVVSPFSGHFKNFANALKQVQARGSGSSFVDAVMLAVKLLDSRPAERRRVAVVIAEARDRSSKTGLKQA
ncbi:MAG: VWA domain-containing protein, partial [Acidobacteriota bacterium]|nr:VWA domain-containing protein [Acidobacteriota bacterium]